MKRVSKQLLCLVLALSMLLGVIPAAAATETAGTAKVYDITVNDLTAPVGIDDPTPSFSWKMDSDAVGAAQTAYNIVVTDPKGTTMWDSGWVESDDSVGIDYAGNALAPSTEYTVAVKIKDQDGVETAATATTFEMGLLDEGFGDAQWISYDADTNGWSGITAYTIDFDFIIDSGSQGFFFGMADSKNYVMWQINAYKYDNVYLRPHFKVNGSWNTGTEVDVSETIGYNSADVIGKTIHERIEVNGTEIKLYFGPDAENLTLAHTYTHTAEIPLCNIGFRQNTSSTGGTEICRYDNIVVADATGVLYSEDFSEDAALDGSTAYSVEEGMLLTGSEATGENVYIVMAEADQSTNLPAFRKGFTPEKEVASAKLYTSGLGVYESYINGQRVGRKLDNGTVEYHELKPGFTELDERMFYSAYDVTWMLTERENVLSATISDGWWSGYIVGGYGGEENAYLAKLILTYSDGTSETIVTDTSWKSAKESPLQDGTGIFEGERYDATVSTAWMQPGYDDSQWTNVKANTEFQGEVVAWDGEYVTVRKDRELVPKQMYVYDSVTGEADGYYGTVNTVRSYTDSDVIALNPGETLVVDFGQNFAGWEAFSVQAEAGTTIQVEHGEILNGSNGAASKNYDGPEGSVYNGNYRVATANTIYTAAGNGTESYHPSNTYYGFRYAAFTADKAVTFTNIRGQVVTSVKEDTAWMTTSDADVNQLFSNVRWGMYSNYLSIPTDCPQRSERMGWTGDTQVFSETGAYMGSNKSFLEKYLQDLRDTQNTSGAYPCVAPFGFGGYNNGYGRVGWSDAGVIIPYYLYMVYGDTATVAEHWDSMVLYMDTFLASTDGMGGEGTYGDWMAYESNDSEIKSILGVAYYAWDALMMAQMAEGLGKTEEAAKYQAVYEAEKELFQSLYVNEDGTLIRSEQTPCLYALYLDLLPDEASVAAVTNQLISNIQSNGNKLQTGFLGTEIIMHTLTKIGRSDVAYKLLLQHNSPSWLYAVDQGATTTWESWNAYSTAGGIRSSGNSLNHYSYGAVASWMLRGMAGISYDAAEPGFKHIVLAPQPDQSLPTVETTYESAYGTIVSNMNYVEDVWNYSCTIPANTTATIKLPVEQIDTLTANGESDLTAVEGLTYGSYENGIATFEAVAGTYTFASKVEIVGPAETMILEVSGADAVPLNAAVCVNGAQVANELPATLSVYEGDVITATVTPMNDVDYGVTKWTMGEDVICDSGELTYTVTSFGTITANVEYTGYENLAVGAAVTADQHNSDWSATYLTDGILNTLGGSRGWSSASRGTGSLTFEEYFATIDMGESKSFNRFQLYPRNYGVTDTALEGFPVAYTIYVSDDNETWTPVYTTDAGAVPDDVYTPLVIRLREVVEGRYVRLGVTEVNKLDMNNRAFVQLNELGVYKEDVYTLTIDTDAAADVPITNVSVCLNGEEVATALPAAVAAMKGDVITATFVPKNSVDYAVTKWTMDGATITEGGQLNHTVSGTGTITANVEYIGYENLAVGASVEAVQHNTSWRAAYLTDGILNVLGGNNGWSSSSRGTGSLTFDECTATIDMGESKTFNRFQLYPRNLNCADTALEGFPVAYTIYVSRDNATWTPVYTTDAGELPANVYTPLVIQLSETIEARYVRLGVTQVNKLDQGNRAFVQLSELGVYKETVHTITIATDAAADVPITNVSVCVNGEEVATALPAAVTVQDDDVITAAFTPKNSVDYAVTKWSMGGKVICDSGELRCTVTGSGTITANVEYIGYENIAVGAAVEAVQHNASWSAAYLTDGILNVLGGNNGWSSTSRGTGSLTFEECTATIDLGESKTFNRFQLYPRNLDCADTALEGFPVAYTIYVSDDNATWTPIYTTEEGTLPANVYTPAIIQLDEVVEARYVRLGVTQVNALDFRDRAFVQLSELGIYTAAARIGDTWYETVQDAVDAAGAGDVVKLLADSAEEVTVAAGKTLYLDLNGYDLAQVTVNGTFYGMDTTTDDYACGEDDYGKIGTIVGEYDEAYRTTVTGVGKRYVAVTGNGGISFHRFYLGITHIALRPGRGGAGYTMTLAGDDKVKSAMTTEAEDGKVYGYTVYLKDHKENGITCSGTQADFLGGIQKMTPLTLNNVLSTANTAEVNKENAENYIICVEAFVMLNNEKITTNTIEMSFKDIVLATDKALNISALSDTQKEALLYLYDDLGVKGMGWNLVNIPKLAENTETAE